MAVDLGNCRLFEWDNIPTTDETGSYPSFLMSHTVTPLGAQLYVFGGMVGLGAARSFTNTSVFVLNVNSHVWRTLDVEMPDEVPRSRHVSFLVGDNLYTFGGANEEYLNDLWHLNFLDEEWEKVYPRGDPPRPRSLAVGELVESMGEFVVFGGIGEGDRLFNDTFCFNVEAQAWTVPKIKGTAPSARYGHASCSAGRTMFVYGGEGVEEEEAEGEGEAAAIPVKYDDMYTLSFANHAWTWSAVDTGANTPPGRSVCSFTLAAGRIFMYGGRSMEGEMSDLYFFDIKTKTFHKVKESTDDKKSFFVQPNSIKVSYHKATYAAHKLIVLGGRGLKMQQLELKPKVPRKP